MKIELNLHMEMKMMKMKKEDEARAAHATMMPDDMQMIRALNLRSVRKRAQEPCMKHMQKGETLAQRDQRRIKEARAAHAARMQKHGNI